MTSISLTLRRSALALSLLSLGAMAHAASYHAVIDTTGLSSSGWLDIQFNPGEVPAVGASVTLIYFSGAFGSEFDLIGGTGSLASGFTLSNATQFNDLFHSLTLGGKISFDVSFDGAFAQTSGQVGTTFSVGLLAADQISYLGRPGCDAAKGENCSLFQIELMPMNGAAPASVSLRQFDGSIATVTAAVPEPANSLLMLAGLGVLGGAVRRRLRRD